MPAPRDRERRPPGFKRSLRPPPRKKKRPSSGYAHYVLTPIVIAVVVILAVSAIRYYRNLAYGTAAKHALAEFASVQQRYRLENGRFAGSEGDFVEGGDQPVSTFTPTFEFAPSQGVRIVIISGDGVHPERDPSFKAKATHERARSQYVYDFAKHTMEESEAQP